MAQMGFCDKHNMVAFLQKPSGSEKFHQIVDFLADSHIMYALTANPTIYVSLVEQFWQTATVKIVNDGEQQITVTIDGHKFAITEASKRFLNAHNAVYVAPSLKQKLFSNMKIGFLRVHVPLFDTMLLHNQLGQGEGPTVFVESQHTPTTSSSSTSQPTTSQPTSSQAPSSHKPTSEPITTTSSPHLQETQIPQTTYSMPYDSPLPGAYATGIEVQSQKRLKPGMSVLSAGVKYLLDVPKRKAGDIDWSKTVEQTQRDNQINDSFQKGMSYDHSRLILEEYIQEEWYPKLIFKKDSDFEVKKSTEEPKELSEEDLKKMLEIVPVKEFRVEALQTNLVKEKFRSVEPTEDMERALWVEFKRLYEPDKEDTLWKLQRYMHDPLTWRLYGSCAVHHVFSTKRHCIYMLPEKDYPLTTEVMMLMLSRSLQVEEDSEMARYLVKKIFIEANRSRS
ncbi:hypothetical protein Tco_0682949 [Tanacetum coccineum]|uniref:Xylulose kinase-1 n=1 Tax=Tanacetum coccineum TaxID=301880 RepID=A0ABQ4XSV1_9ASTR